MEQQAEKIEEKLEGFNLELFTIPDESAFIPGEEFEKQTVEDKKEKIKDEDIKDEEEDETLVTDSDEEEDEDEKDEKLENKDEDVDLSDIDKTISELLDKGILLLPDDYEYEDSKEGLEKAFQDSENFRNQLAFQEAIKYLTSKEGSNLIKIKDSSEKIESYKNLDTEKLDSDSMFNIIRDAYKLKEYDDEDIDSIIEDLVGNETKTKKEFSVALKHLIKKEEKESAEEFERIEKDKIQREKIYKESQNILKEKLQTKTDYNGYVINDSNKDKIFNATYKPIKLEDGTVTNEISKILAEVMNNPDEYLVLADLLLKKTDKGFDFSNIEKKAETKAAINIKKSIRDFKNTNNKNKATGKNSQTQTDFDLSKASLGFKY